MKKSLMYLPLIVPVLLTLGSQDKDARTSEGPRGGRLEWQKLPDMPEGKWEPGTAVIDGKLYVFGGYAKGVKSSKRCDSFDPADGSWTRIQDLPSAISHVNLVVDGRTICFAGGFKDGYPGHAIAEAWCYDLELDRFIAAPLLPEKRGGGGLALLGRNLHFVGGLKPDRDTDAADHWVLNLDEWAEGAGQWTNAAPMPVPRNQFSCVEFEGEMYTIGGQFHHDSIQDNQPTVEIYNPKSDSWRDGPTLLKGHSHAEGSTFVHDNRIYMVGGHSQPEGERIALDSDIVALAPGGSWEVVGQLPKPLSSPAAAIVGGKLYVAGGFDGRVKAEVWVTEAP
jgi:N-acetylneuraminic acid mutarotase